MNQSKRKALLNRLFLFVMFGLLLINFSCNPPPQQAPRVYRVDSLEPGRIVVLGFFPALSPGEQAHIVRDPLSGGIFLSEQVSKSTVELMNDMLMKRLAERRLYTFIRPGEARGVLAELAKDDKMLADTAINIIQTVGRRMRAEAVIVGHIYRWRQRQGGKYAVQRPASVAFDMNLVRVDDGQVLWNAKFDKEQRSLSENVFDYKTFFGGKGRWMTAEELASLGLDQVMKQIPLEISVKAGSKGDSNSSD